MESKEHYKRKEKGEIKPIREQSEREEKNSKSLEKKNRSQNGKETGS